MNAIKMVLLVVLLLLVPQQMPLAESSKQVDPADSAPTSPTPAPSAQAEIDGFDWQAGESRRANRVWTPSGGHRLGGDGYSWSSGRVEIVDAAPATDRRSSGD